MQEYYILFENSHTMWLLITDKRKIYWNSGNDTVIIIDWIKYSNCLSTLAFTVFVIIKEDWHIINFFRQVAFEKWGCRSA